MWKSYKKHISISLVFILMLVYCFYSTNRYYLFKEAYAGNIEVQLKQIQQTLFVNLKMLDTIPSEKSQAMIKSNHVKMYETVLGIENHYPFNLSKSINDTKNIILRSTELRENLEWRIEKLDNTDSKIIFIPLREYYTQLDVDLKKLLEDKPFISSSKWLKKVGRFLGDGKRVITN